MIEQVFVGGGGGGGLDVPLFLGQFLRATIFLCRFFSIRRCLFMDRFYQYLHIFAVYYVHFIKKSNCFLGTKFS